MASGNQRYVISSNKQENKENQHHITHRHRRNEIISIIIGEIKEGGGRSSTIISAWRKSNGSSIANWCNAA